MFLHQLWSVVIKPMFQHSSGTTMGSSISKRPQLNLSSRALFALTNARCVP